MNEQIKHQVNILLWNTYKKGLHSEIKALTVDHDLDIIALIENNGNDDQLKISLSDYKEFTKAKNIIFQKGKIFFSDKIEKIREVRGHGRYGIYHCKLANKKDLILALTHMPSKRDWNDPIDQLGLCSELRIDIEKIEDKLETSNTIIIGDFNMNPFEVGLVHANGLHNTSLRSIAKLKQRTIQRNSYQYFYNPMWNFLGEFSKGIESGTHYYETYKYINYHWNIYDQVMLRPNLLESFEEESLEIINNIRSKSLTINIKDKKRVDKRISDHLPIKFTLQIDKIKEDEEPMAR